GVANGAFGLGLQEQAVNLFRRTLDPVLDNKVVEGGGCQGGDNADDGDNHHQLHQGKAALAVPCGAPGTNPAVCLCSACHALLTSGLQTPTAAAVLLPVIGVGKASTLPSFIVWPLAKKGSPDKK